MALTFNGSNSHLYKSSSGIVTGYPFTIFLWTRATSYQTGFAAHVAVDPSPTSGTAEGHGIIQSSGKMQAWSTASGTGGATAAFAYRSVTTNDWVPCMAVFSSTGLRRIYYGSGGVRTSTVTIPQNPSLLDTLSIGKQAVRSAYYWQGDLACVAVWRTELAQADFDSLAAGAIPSGVQSAYLVDYWPLLTQGATQLGIRGGVLVANNTSQAASHPIAESAVSADSTAPSFSGSLVVSAITSTSYTLGWPTATDNVGVVSYERSVDGGNTWLNVGNVLSTTVSGRTPSTTDAVRVRALDAAGNTSAALSTSVSLLAAADTSAPLLSGNIAVSAITTSSYTLAWPAATDNVGVVGYDVSLNGGTNWADVGNALAYNAAGRTAGATDAVRVRARDAAGNVSAYLSTSVTLLTPVDITSPTFSGTISVSGLNSTGYTLTWPAATDNVAISTYERSLDGGSTWTSLGNVLTSTVTGRAPGAIDQVAIRARDTAGNVSAPLTTSVSLPAVAGTGGFATPPLKNNTGVLLANLTGLTVNVYNASTGVLVVRKTGLSSNADGVVSIVDSNLLAGTSYAYEIVTPSNGRRLPIATAA